MMEARDLAKSSGSGISRDVRLPDVLGWPVIVTVAGATWADGSPTVDLLLVMPHGGLETHRVSPWAEVEVVAERLPY